jgi:ATP-dependent protease HslVU (ClpYQ) peptidase subunit
MTSIAYRNGIMAADTLMVQGGTIMGHLVKIVRRDDGHLAGAAGDCSWAQAFHRWFLAGEEGDLPEQGDNAKGIIARPDKTVQFSEPGGLISFKAPFAAIGCGRDVMLGAMWMGAPAIAAVQAAIALDPYCGGDITVLTHA